MNVIGIIPARFASTRFPGKPLAHIGGRSMIQRVYEQAKMANLQEVLVATDDDRIFDHVLNFGGNVVLTSPHHPSGTDRCFEAYQLNDQPFDYVVNIQGDEPFIMPEQINRLVECFRNPLTQIATLVKQIHQEAELFNPNVVKAVRDQAQQAIYFSRHPIPYNRQHPQDQWLVHATYYKHLGIYGYRSDILEQITRLQPSPLELSESLEQLRWLENGFRIMTAETDMESIGIDTPEDLEAALKRIS